MDLEQLIGRAKQGDLAAFAEVTRRFQHTAFGYALSIVRDLQQAEDVVQEAFVAAWFGLLTLADPAAFPGWFRGIVRHHCTQQDIATFLGLPLTTVNNRLHAARTQLKRRTLTMVKDTLEAHRPPDDFAARIGRIVRAREGVVEVLFDPTRLPDPLTELTVSDEGRRRAVTVQVVQLLDDGVVRCVPMSPIEGLSPGTTVLSSGRRAEAPVSREVLEGAVRLLAGAAREPSHAPELLESGIKVIDLMCPLVRGGTVAIAGEYAAGTMVVTEELCRRLNSEPGGVSIFTFVPPGPGLSFQEVWAKDGFTGGTVGAVQTFYFVGEEAWTAERLSALPAVDVVIRLSRELARLGIYPPIDAIVSRSRLLDEKLVDQGHAQVAARAREALTLVATAASGSSESSAELGVRMRRARKLLRFFAQPFFVAEAYTRVPGSRVNREESVRTCREILDGLHDDLPEEAFYFVGGIDEVSARAARLSAGDRP